ncbi:MAG: FCD domain-containing protein [Alphaproteobacteria bacterium]|nr:FCD domain-containing protein [Alphaproteobacteria bacterium]
METAARTADVPLFLKADKTFDAILETACANPFLGRCSPLQTHSRRFWVRYSSDRDLRASAAHVQVMKDITRHDEEAAERSMTALMEALNSKARSLVR